MNDINPLNKALGQLFWPNRVQNASGTVGPQPGQPTDWLRTARWAAAAITVFSTGIQFIVWAMITVISQSVDAPWWLWSTIPGVIVTAFLSWMITTREQLDSTQTDPEPKPALV